MSNAISDLHERLVEAGWPAKIGLNDKRTTSHRYYSLDGSRVHSYWTRGGTGFFLWDPELKLITKGKSADEAAINMVLAREIASPRVHGTQGRMPNGRLRVSVPSDSPLKGKRLKKAKEV